MIKVEYSLYQLKPRVLLNAAASTLPRPGALLKLTFENGLVGYGDLFPWPEWGDYPIDVELERLARGKVSALAEQSFSHARRDAELRRDRINANEKLPRVRNHYLIPDVSKINVFQLRKLTEDSFTTLKIKVGRDIEIERQWIEATTISFPFKLRLDFNLQGDHGKFEKLLLGLTDFARSKIEFVEDPFPYSLNAWIRATKIAPIALDQEAGLIPYDEIKDQLPFSVVIIKPARIDSKIILDQMNRLQFKIAVTSSMDHPIGMAHAARVAGEIKRFYPNSLLECGCLSHHIYESDKFSDLIISKGPFITQIPGYGIGFDHALSGIEWKSFSKTN